VQGVAPGGSSSATVFLPPDTTVDTYYKYGRTPDQPDPHWYEFLYDGTTGAEILPDRIILHFVDGQRGDDDLEVNGQIVDLGAPGLSPTPEERIAAILQFFDASVENGTLVGCGRIPRVAQAQLRALREMIEASAELIRRGLTRAARLLLTRAYQRTDGERWPLPDFVEGEAAPVLADMILELIERLECE
jgi:hypothetical protein